jgi:hypothetical protein
MRARKSAAVLFTSLIVRATFPIPFLPASAIVEVAAGERFGRRGQGPRRRNPVKKHATSRAWVGVPVNEKTQPAERPALH